MDDPFGPVAPVRPQPREAREESTMRVRPTRRRRAASHQSDRTLERPCATSSARPTTIANSMYVTACGRASRNRAGPGARAPSAATPRAGSRPRDRVAVDDEWDQPVDERQRAAKANEAAGRPLGGGGHDFEEPIVVHPSRVRRPVRTRTGRVRGIAPVSRSGDPSRVPAGAGIPQHGDGATERPATKGA